MYCRNEKNDSSEPWDWQGAHYILQKDSNTHKPNCLWNGATQNEEGTSSMFNETTTPIKACSDFAYRVAHSDGMDKEPEDRREAYSRVKRRRVLHFNAEAMDLPDCSKDMSYAFLKSNEREDFLDKFSPEMSQWVSGFSDASASASSHDAVDPSYDGWLAECLNDTDMTFSSESDDVNFSGETDVQIGISDLCLPECERNPIQQRASRPSKNVIFKGIRMSSYLRSPTKLASSITYPFAFIKPCGIHGDVTLNDINQRIHTPPPSKPKSDDDLSASFPTSAFSGKPVVVKTKILTEGGKGSITIMRTKG